ncbi:MAG: dihydrodipicolinate synthase family protein [Candidatus Binatia bacterium]
MKDIKGIVMPLLTPFKDDGELDEPIGCEIADFLIGTGVNALFLLGSFGQGPVMRVDQRKRYAELIFKHVRGRVPVVIHVGTADAYSTTELGLHAKSLGCDAVALVGPYYYSDHTEFEIIEHFKEVARKVEMPMLLYNNPPYQGFDIAPPMMLRLKEEIPQIFGAKLSTDNFETALSYLSQLPADFSLFGLSASIMPAALYGIRGTIIPPMIAYPELGVALWRALEARRLEEALQLQINMNELQKTFRGLGRIYGRSVQCEAVRARGFAVKKFPRWTTKPLQPHDRETLIAAMRKAGLSIRA